MNKSNKNINFDTIVRQYKKMVQLKPDKHLKECNSQECLTDAIMFAAKSVDNNNKRHNHQRRISKINLALFSEKLKIKEKEINNSKSFDELFKIVNGINIKGIGELTKYDTTERIASYKNLFPEKIYLHSGTRTGAKKLIGKLNGKKYLDKNDIPKEFLKYNFVVND